MIIIIRALMRRKSSAKRRNSGSYAVRKSISLPGFLLEHASIRARNGGFSALSDYVQHLIRLDGFEDMIGRDPQ
jgi:hypothetical protein